MAVHVDEIHTDVVPGARPASDGREHAPDRLDGTGEAWRAAERLAQTLAQRVAARGFDD